MPNAAFSAAPRGSLWPLIPLAAVVVLRSVMGSGPDYSWRGDYAAALVIALALGKAAGGFLADRFSPGKTAALSLFAAGALYLAGEWPVAGLGAVFLFNMTMPITLHAAARRLPGAKGFSFGLLTFALFLGFLPTAMGWESRVAGPVPYALGALVSVLLLWWGLGKEGEQ